LPDLRDLCQKAVGEEGSARPESALAERESTRRFRERGKGAQSGCWRDETGRGRRIERGSVIGRGDAEGELEGS
jgi:hypothetical protein